MNPAPKGAATEVPVEAQAAGAGVMSAPATVLGPIACLNCRMSVAWVRWESRWLLYNTDSSRRHDCPAKEKAA